MKVACEAGTVRLETQDVRATARELHAGYGTYVRAWDAATDHPKDCPTGSPESVFWCLISLPPLQLGQHQCSVNMFYFISVNRRRSLCVARMRLFLTVFSVVLRMEATVCNLRPS